MLFKFMTFRIYAIWPNKKVSNKTTTTSKAIADAAWNDLVSLSWGDDKPLGLTYTYTDKNNKKTNIDYVDLSCGNNT